MQSLSQQKCHLWKKLFHMLIKWRGSGTSAQRSPPWPCWDHLNLRLSPAGSAIWCATAPSRLHAMPPLHRASPLACPMAKACDRRHQMPWRRQSKMTQDLNNLIYISIHGHVCTMCLLSSIMHHFSPKHSRIHLHNFILIQMILDTIYTGMTVHAKVWRVVTWHARQRGGRALCGRQVAAVGEAAAAGRAARHEGPAYGGVPVASAAAARPVRPTAHAPRPSRPHGTQSRMQPLSLQPPASAQTQQHAPCEVYIHLVQTCVILEQHTICTEAPLDRWLNK